MKVAVKFLDCESRPWETVEMLLARRISNGYPRVLWHPICSQVSFAALSSESHILFPWVADNVVLCRRFHSSDRIEAEIGC